jgi:hypothetical protein
MSQVRAAAVEFGGALCCEILQRADAQSKQCRNGRPSIICETPRVENGWLRAKQQVRGLPR